jgi:PAS domain S-box-containing protein
MLAQVNDAVVATNLEGRITYLNPAAERLYGVGVEDMLGREERELFDEVDLPGEAARAREAALLERGEWRGLSRHRLRDGRTVPVESNYSMFRDGPASGRLAVIRDVTEREIIEAERRDREQALRRADRRKDEFLATLAHELRNPLAPVRNAVQLLQIGSASEVRWAAGVIERQVDQLSRLIDDLMDVGRINQGRLVLRCERAELAEVLERAIEASRPLIERAGHELSVSQPGGSVLVHADVTRLAQVVTNLLNNAAKYTEPGGRIELTAERAGEEILLHVRDNGIGIPPASLPRLFDLFAQVQDGLDRADGGIGIGLFLVRRLVQLHGGSIEARSEGPGRGSEFIVRLPIVAEFAPAHDATPAEPASTGTGSRLRIAVVDDNEDAAMTLCRLLEHAGHTAHEAHDGEEALALVETLRPQVVLLDIGLPRLSGYEVAKSIRRQPYGRDMLLIATTGWGLENDRQQSVASGFDHHLVKPIEVQGLMQMLERLEPGRRTAGR